MGGGEGDEKFLCQGDEMGKIFLFSLQNYHFVQRKLFIGSEQFHSDFDTKKHLLGEEVCIYNTKNKKGIVQVL